MQAVVVQKKMPNFCACVVGEGGGGGVLGAEISENLTQSRTQISLSCTRSPWAPACTEVENLVTRLTSALASQKNFATAELLRFSLFEI